MAAIISQWWRRLVNGYAVTAAGMVCLQRKNCVIHILERFRGKLLTMVRYTNLSSFSVLLAKRR